MPNPTAGPIRRRRPRHDGLDVNRDRVRYFVYRLADAEGRVLYVGRSYDPLARLRQHHSEGSEWARQVVQVEAWGPFRWAEVLRQERAAIERERPPHNREFVTTKRRRADGGLGL